MATTIRPSRRAGARIAIAGASVGSAAVGALQRAELEDVRFVNAAAGGDDLAGADTLVLVAAAGETADAAATRRLAAAARERGLAVAAVIAGDGAATATPSPLLAVMREAADLVMLVRDGGDVRGIVAALR